MPTYVAKVEAEVWVDADSMDEAASMIGQMMDDVAMSHSITSIGT